jgi:thiol-disulfide isomerase/thioredoxin
MRGMRKEAKSAIIAGIVVIAGVTGIALYFASLDKPVNSGNLNLVQPSSSNTPTNHVDESQYPIAPDLAGIAGYVNTSPDDLKTKMKDKVVLYDFWTYSCINCIRTFPYLKAWNEKYADKGLLIIGVHSPEFEFEKDINNVKMATQKYGITYPVVLDSDHQIWDAFNNRYWPAEYITDYLGHIRHAHFGEGDYDQTEQTIQQLIAERAQHLGLNIGPNMSLVNLQPHQFSNQQTPELYFGYQFATGRSFLGNDQGFQPEKTVSYMLPSNLSQDRFYLEGNWQNLPDSMKLASGPGKIVLSYYAKDVHLVATAPGTDVQILLDGNTITSDYAGQDVQNGIVHIAENRLYNIVSSQQAGSHTLTLLAKPGFQIYTFTFG